LPDLALPRGEADMPPTGQTTQELDQVDQVTDKDVRRAGNRILAVAKAIYRYKKTLYSALALVAWGASWAVGHAYEYAADDYAQTKAQAAAAIAENKATAALVEARWLARNAEMGGYRGEVTGLKSSVDEAKQELKDLRNEVRVGFKEQNEAMNKWAQTLIGERRAASWEAAP
jgi:hypothetical protein